MDNSRLTFEGYSSRNVTLNAQPKDQLVQAVICRWWYCIEWPRKEDAHLVEKEAKQFYHKMAGYEGVQIGVEVSAFIFHRTR